MKRRQFIKTFGRVSALPALPLLSILPASQVHASWFLLRLMPFIGRVLGAGPSTRSIAAFASNGRRAAIVGGAGVASAGYASGVNASSAVRTALNAWMVSDIYEIFSHIDESVQADIKTFGADALWINGAPDSLGLHNMLFVSAWSKYKKYLDDNLIVSATDLSNGHEEVLFRTSVKVQPKQVNEFGGRVTSFQSNGVKRVTARLEKNKLSFSEKIVVISDLSSVRLKEVKHE